MKFHGIGSLPLLPAAEDRDFYAAWDRVEEHLLRHQSDFVLLQCGADSLAGDPLADLRLSPAAYAHAARRSTMLADDLAQGRLLVLGGGGYDAGNVAAAWAEVLQEFDRPRMSPWAGASGAPLRRAILL